MAGLVPVLAVAQHPEIGQVQLRNEFGAVNVDGTGVNLLHVEAPNGNGDYIPDASIGDLSAKTFVDLTGTSATASAHATNVGRMIYGSDRGVATGVGEAGSPAITNREANDWIFGQLGANFDGDTSPDQAPILQDFEVSNHSYIANPSTGFPEADLVNALQRMDWMINQTDMSAVVGSSNGGSSTTPGLWTQSYNVISVGLSNGNHGSTLSTLNGAGRLPIDVVAPTPNDFANTTSNATGVVSGAVAILRQASNGISDADNSEVIKATLLAGATKEEFPGWSRTTTRPLDQTFGAGETNIYNSYRIQQAGQIEGESGDPVNVAGENGWDFQENFTVGDELFYEFEVGSGEFLEDLSIILSWNAVIDDTNAAAGIFEPALSVADLSMDLFNSDGGFLDTLIDSSDSDVDNLEHIWMPLLSEGTYHIRITNNSTGSIDTDYALAFRSVAVPEPSSIAFLCAVMVLGLTHRKRWA